MTQPMKEKEYIYIVFGVTGEYEDSMEWNVKAFRTLRKAKNFHKKLMKIVEDNKLDNKTFGREYDQSVMDCLYALDKNARCDYTGMSYHIAHVELG